MAERCSLSSSAQSSVDLPADFIPLRYDEARRRMRRIVELPEPCGRPLHPLLSAKRLELSAAKRRKGGLEKLTDDEVAALETAVREAFEEGAVSHE